MPLSPEHREFLEYLRTMLNGLETSTYSENLELIIETIDAALLEASEIREVSDGDANALLIAKEADHRSGLLDKQVRPERNRLDCRNVAAALPSATTRQ